MNTRSFPPPGAPPPGQWSWHVPGSGTAAGTPPGGRDGLRERAPKLLLTAVALGLLALGALALLGGPSESAPLTPVAEAADRTARLPGARFAGSGHVVGPDQALVFRMPFRGVYDSASGRVFMRARYEGLTQHLPPELAGTEPIFVGVQDPEAMYMRSPLFAGQLPGGSGWMKIDFSELGVSASEAGGMDAHGLLESLRAVSPSVQKLGTERVRGNRATRYAAVLDPDLHAEQLRDAGNEVGAEIVEAEVEPSRVEVWIDGRGLVRRVTGTQPFSVVGGEGTRIEMAVEYFDFGIEPEIDLPPEDRVFDTTELGKLGLESEYGVDL